MGPALRSAVSAPKGQMATTSTRRRSRTGSSSIFLLQGRRSMANCSGTLGSVFQSCGPGLCGLRVPGTFRFRHGQPPGRAPAMIRRTANRNFAPPVFLVCSLAALPASTATARRTAHALAEIIGGTPTNQLCPGWFQAHPCSAAHWKMILVHIANGHCPTSMFKTRVVEKRVSGWMTHRRISPERPQKRRCRDFQPLVLHRGSSLASVDPGPLFREPHCRRFQHDRNHKVNLGAAGQLRFYALPDAGHATGRGNRDINDQ